MNSEIKDILRAAIGKSVSITFDDAVIALHDAGVSDPVEILESGLRDGYLVASFDLDQDLNRIRLIGLPESSV